MAKVPHDVSSSSLVKMEVGAKVIDTLLRFLNSCGTKPWRPRPLSPIVQQGLRKELLDKVSLLSYVHSTNFGADKDFSNIAHYARQLVSVFGIIEESIEYLNTIGKKTRQESLEEITDILFFYLELVLLGGFSLEEIEDQYVRKHAVNLERYRRAKEGDYGWDDRGKGEL